MKCFLWMALVLVCAVAEARAPESMKDIPEVGGWLNTKPDADGNCWLHICGGKIPIESVSQVGAQSHWDFLTQDVEMPIPLSPIEAMANNMGNVNREEIPGEHGGVTIKWSYEFPTDEEGNRILPYIPTENDLCDYIFECKSIEETWQWDLLAQYDRISGTAKFPAGKHLTIVQNSDQECTSTGYIVDRDTNTVWRLKPQPQLQ